jgi:hypoxanthine phosphoribosyltransferase
VEIVLDKVKVLFSAEQIQDRVSALAKQISSDYKYSTNLVIIGVLKGAFIFTSDLVRHLTVPCQIEFIRLSSYHEGTTSSGKVKPYLTAIRW